MYYVHASISSSTNTIHLVQAGFLCSQLTDNFQTVSYFVSFVPILYWSILNTENSNHVIICNTCSQSLQTPMCSHKKSWPVAIIHCKGSSSWFCVEWRGLRSSLLIMESFGDINALLHISQFVFHLDKTGAKNLVWPKTLMISA